MLNILATLTLLIALELVLGVDNILVISILVNRLPEDRQNKARLWGLGFAFIFRIFALILLINITGVKDSIIFNYSVRDIVLLLGGMFLMWKAIREIHHTIEFIGEADVQVKEGNGGLSRVILDIVILDIVFSLDSVITAIGLTRNLWVITLAVMISFIVVLMFAKPIGDFILKKPSIKILALSFLITIGITLFMEGLHQHVPRGYIYLPMGFAIMVELLQMRYEYNKNKIKTGESS